jgi:hypothetical protein
VPRYFYASGERVPIERDEDQVAIDIGRAGQAAIDDVLEQAGAGAAQRLQGRVVVVSRKAVGKLLTRLEAAGALQPVYRHESAVLVPLPEVRVELDPGQRKAVLAAIEESPVPAEVVDENDDRVVLRPRSGNGDDAIALANHIFEKAKPAASAVDFVRFVPKPRRESD